MKKILLVASALALLAGCSTNTNKKGGSAASSNIDVNSRTYFEKNIGDTVHFDFNSATVDSNQKVVLSKQAQWLKSNSSVSCTIEGHCDSRGTREYNLGLGEKRANSVKKYLSAEGVDSSKVSTVSYGKERPIAIGNDDATHVANRRAKTVVQSK